MSFKRTYGFLALVAIALIVAICFVTYIVEIRGRDLALRASTVLEDLVELGERLDSGVTQVDEKGTDELSPVEGIETNQSAQSVAMTSELLPTRLKRKLSPQEMTKLNVATDRKRRIELLFRSTALRVGDSVRFVFGKGPQNGIHTSSALAYDMIALGDWESARQYLLEAAEVYAIEDPTQCKITLGVLAWFEEDLEKATRLLELSCRGEFRKPYPPYEDAPGLAASQLSNAYRLCRETESHALAEHYLARLWEEYPEFAEQFGVVEPTVERFSGRVQ